MAGLFDKQVDLYADARPTYPSQWYSMLADRTLHHSLAWDVGTGNGQAAIGVSIIFLLSFQFHDFKKLNNRKYTDYTPILCDANEHK